MHSSISSTIIEAVCLSITNDTFRQVSGAVCADINDFSVNNMSSLFFDTVVYLYYGWEGNVKK